MNELLEYQVVMNVYLPDGRTVKHVVRSSDRETAITKFKYLETLVKDKRRTAELREWSAENLPARGLITGLEGIFGVAYIKIL